MAENALAESLRRKLTVRKQVSAKGEYGTIHFDVILEPSDDVVESLVEAVKSLEDRAEELLSKASALEKIASGITVGKVRLVCDGGSCRLKVECLGGDCGTLERIARVEAGVLPSLATEVYTLDPLDAVRGSENPESAISQIAYRLSLFQSLVSSMADKFGSPGDPGEPRQGIYTVFEADRRLVDRYNNIVEMGFWAVRLRETNGAVTAVTENLVSDGGSNPLAASVAAKLTGIVDELLKLRRILGEGGKRDLVDELLLLIWYDRLLSRDDRVELLRSVAEKGKLLLDEELAKKLGVDIDAYRSVYGFKPAVLIVDEGGASYILEQLAPELGELKRIIANPPIDECTGSRAVGLLAEIGKRLKRPKIAKLYMKAAKMGLNLKYLVPLNALINLATSIDEIRNSISAALGKNEDCSPCAERALFAAINEPSVYRCNGKYAVSTDMDVESAAKKAYDLIELAARHMGVKPGVTRDEFVRDLTMARLGTGRSLDEAAKVVNRVIERALRLLEDRCVHRLCDNVAQTRLPFVDSNGSVDTRYIVPVHVLREKLGDRIDWSMYDKLVSRCSELCGWGRSGNSETMLSHTGAQPNTVR